MNRKQQWLSIASVMMIALSTNAFADDDDRKRHGKKHAKKHGGSYYSHHYKHPRHHSRHRNYHGRHYGHNYSYGHGYHHGHHKKHRHYHYGHHHGHKYKHYRHHGAHISLNIGRPIVIDRVVRREYIPTHTIAPSRHVGSAHYEEARVLYVEPIVRNVRVSDSQYECWDEAVTRTVNNGDTAAATIAGGLVGGVIGRQFGSGSGRDGMTLVGTLVGSAIANDQASRHSGTTTYHDTVERCATRPVSYEEERIEGYYVTYEYNGREYQTRLSYDPGATIRIRVNVSPG